MEANPKVSNAPCSEPPNTKYPSLQDRSGTPPKMITPLNRDVVQSRYAISDTLDFISRRANAQSTKNSKPLSMLSTPKTLGQHFFQTSRKNVSQQRHQPQSRSLWQSTYMAVTLLFLCMFSGHSRSNTSLRSINRQRLEHEVVHVSKSDGTNLNDKGDENKALLSPLAEIQKLLGEVIKEQDSLEKTKSFEESDGEELPLLLNQSTSKETDLIKKTRMEERTPTKLAEAEFNSAHVQPDFGGIVHIIGSRFMQFQPNLIELGKARLELFRNFCLPTIVHQTSKNFLWIIRADPDLNATLKKELIQLIAPYPNFILVASNKFPEGFRDPESVVDVLNPQKVWSGDIELVRAAHDAAQRNIVLETRLDADDGLHKFFVEYLQLDALNRLDRPSRVNDDIQATIEEATESLSEDQWMVWCAFSVIEWHAKSPFSATPPELDSPHGYLLGILDMKCVTPGLTLGYGVNTPRSTIPKAPHNKIHSKIPICEEALLETKCLQRLTGLTPAALRTRTPTSAGMNGVVTGTSGDNLYKRMKNQQNQQQPLWNGTETYLHVMKTKAVDTKKYLMEHVAAIAFDNLKGQCTAGHSCKTSTQKLLQELALTGAGETSHHDELLAFVDQHSEEIVVS